MAFTSHRTGSTNLGPLRCTAAVAAASLGLWGCSPYKAPVLDMTGVAPLEESPEGFVVKFSLSARNDNEVPLPLRMVEYEVRLGPAGPDGWTGSFRGVRSAEATLRADGTQTIVLPAAFSLEPGQRVPEGPVPYRFSADLQYITPGALADVLFDTGVRRPTVSFNRDGVIDFGAAPDAPQP
jgi:hypothetical protein